MGRHTICQMEERGWVTDHEPGSAVHQVDGGRGAYRAPGPRRHLVLQAPRFCKAK